jgi:lysophospholipase L1-like esterase
MAIKSLGKTGGLAMGEDRYNLNYDCLPETYRLEADPFGTMHTGCFTASAFGQIDIANNVVQGFGFSGSIPVKTFGNQAIIPMPKAASIATVSGASPMGSYLHIYTYFPSAVEVKYDWLLQPYLQLPQQANMLLSDTAGNPMIINAQTVGYSANGSWMVVESPWRSFFRVNTATLDILPFAPSFSPVLDYAMHESQVAITDDGRYVAVQNSEFGSFKVYDLKTCKGDVQPSLQPLQCLSHDYQGYIANKIIGLSGIRHLRFVDDGILSFHAMRSDSSDETTYELAPADKIANLIDYLALGDSYSSGEGAFEYRDGTDTSNDLCHQSVKSYPYLLTQDVFNSAGGHSVACSGAIVEDISSKDQRYKGQVRDGISRQNRNNITQILADFTPGYLAQYEFVKKYQPRIMTVGIGGNDIGFVDILEACIEPHARGGNTCYDSYEDRQELADTIDRTYPKWVDMYRQLQSTAPDTAIYAIGYPRIAQVGGDCAVNVHLNESEVELAQYLIDYLNSVIEKAATDSGVTYVDISHALDGHKLCEATNASVAMNGLTAGTDVAHIIGNESYHPNALGHELIEQAILHQTRNFTTAASSSSSTSTAPTKISPDNPLLKAPKTGRKIRTSIPTKSTTSKVVKKGSTVQLQVTGTSLNLKPNSPFTVSLQGSNTVLGTITSDSEGNIDGQVVVPQNTPGGTDILDLNGTNLIGEVVDLTETVDIAVSQDDIDGDGITDTTDSCPTIPNSGQDADQDGIDDTCDGSIGAAPTNSSNSSSTPDSVQATTVDGNTSGTTPSTPSGQITFETVTVTQQGSKVTTSVSKKPASSTLVPAKPSTASVLGASTNTFSSKPNHSSLPRPPVFIGRDNLRIIYWQPWVIDTVLIGLLLALLNVLLARLAN